MNFTTVEAVKARVSLSQEQTDFDDVISAMIGACSARIADYCDRDFEKKQYTQRCADEGVVERVFLRSRPVAEVTSVSIVDRITNEKTAVDRWYETDLKIVFPSGVYLTPPNEIEIVYTAGYTDDTLPLAVRNACERMVAAEFGRRTNEGQMRSEFESSQIQWDKVMTEDIMESLETHRNLEIV